MSFILSSKLFTISYHWIFLIIKVEQENYSFKWKLKKFEDIKINQDWIEKAYIEFYAGSEVDRRSKWRVYLAQKNIDGKSETGIYFKCIEKPTSPGKNLFAKLYVRMKTDAGTDWKWNTGAHIYLPIIILPLLRLLFYLHNIVKNISFPLKNSAPRYVLTSSGLWLPESFQWQASHYWRDSGASAYTDNLWRPCHFWYNIPIIS